MTITPEQIEQLYAFTRKHFVEYYDLQTELVDHLANGIEERWMENPKQTFEEALQKEFKKFGVFGFMNVVEQRRVALTKKYNQLVWQHFKTFLKLPKIILTILTILILKSVLSVISFADEIVLVVFGMLLVVFFGVIFTYGSFVGYSYIPMQLIAKIWNHTEKEYMLWVISVLIAVMVLLEYIMLIEIPRKSEDYLKSTYPEKYA
jgi:hypothetical protein